MKLPRLGLDQDHAELREFHRDGRDALAKHVYGVGDGYGRWAKVYGRVEERLDIARRRERQRDRESCNRTRKRHQLQIIGLEVNEPKESCTRARRTETCVAPRRACRCRCDM